MANMSQANLTHEEARFRTQAISLHSYHLHIDLSQAPNHDQANFPVSTRFEFSTTESDIFLDYLWAEIVSLTINKEPSTFDFRDGMIYFHSLPTGVEVEVEII